MAPKIDPPLIKFGRWDSQLGYIDYKYNGIITKLIDFAKEAGKDKYDRYFNGESLLDFALTNKLTDHTADYIYRHYVYTILSEHQYIDIDAEETRHLLEEFNNGII